MGLFTILCNKKTDSYKIRLFNLWQLFGYHKMAPAEGLEPPTDRLTADSSTD